MKLAKLFGIPTIVTVVHTGAGEQAAFQRIIARGGIDYMRDDLGRRLSPGKGSTGSWHTLLDAEVAVCR